MKTTELFKKNDVLSIFELKEKSKGVSLRIFNGMAYSKIDKKDFFSNLSKQDNATFKIDIVNYVSGRTLHIKQLTPSFN